MIQSGVQEMYAQIVYKDNKIMELNNKILDHEKKMMDLQEFISEKNEVIKGRDKVFEVINTGIWLNNIFYDILTCSQFRKFCILMTFPKMWIAFTFKSFQYLHPLPP